MQMTDASESTGTLVDTEVPSKPNFHPTGEIRKMGVPQEMGRGIGGAGQLASGHVVAGSRSRGVPVAPLQLEGEKPLAKAFATPTKVIGTIALVG